MAGSRPVPGSPGRSRGNVRNEWGDHIRSPHLAIDNGPRLSAFTTVLRSTSFPLPACRQAPVGPDTAKADASIALAIGSVRARLE